MKTAEHSLGRVLTLALLGLSIFWLVAMRIPTAVWFGNFTLNAYLTGIAALLAGSLALLTVILFATKNPPLGRPLQDAPKAVIVASLSGIPLLAYSVISLALNFRIEGFQNTLVWAAFSLTLLALPHWLSSADAVFAKKLLRVVVTVVPATKIISLYGGFDFYGEATYALVAVVLLAYAVSQTPRAWFDLLSPWLLLTSILLCDVRTAAVVAALLMIFSVKHYEVSSKIKTFLVFTVAFVSGLLVWVAVGDRFVNSGDSGLAQFVGEDSILAGIGTTNRAAAWAFILENLPAGTNWFGQGSGESSFLADELLGIHHPHNEYLRIFYDFGWLGLALFLAGSAALFTATVLHWKTLRSDLAMAGVLLIPAIALMAVTDNPIVFVYVMVPAATIIALGFHDSGQKRQSFSNRGAAENLPPQGQGPQLQSRVNFLPTIALYSRSGVIAIALFLLVFQAQAVFIRIGPYSLSAYAIVGAALLILISTTASVMSAVIDQRKAGEKASLRSLGRRFSALWPLLALLFFAAGWLVVEWRLEGAQNLAALVILAVGILAFSFETSGVRSEKILAAFLYVGLAVSAVFIIFTASDLEGFANRQFAMIALIPLSIAVVWPAKTWLIRVSPFVFTFAILFSQSRTTSFIAVMLLALHFWLSATKPPKLIWASVAAIATAAIVGIGVFFGPALAENFGWLKVEDRELLGTSGRLTAWLEFLALLDSPLKWAFGIGTGGAMQFGTAQVPWFSHPHNEYLRYLVDVGIIGLLLLLLGAALLLVTFGKEWKNQEPITRASFLLIVALGLMASTDGPLYSSFVIIPSAIVIGLGLAQVVRRPHPSSRAANRSGL